MTDQNNNPADESDEVLTTIFERAKSRPRPSERAERQAFENLHARWQAGINARKRRSYLKPFGLAAALVLAVGLVWQARTPNESAPLEVVASIARVTGNLATVQGPQTRPVAASIGEDVHENVALSTGADSRLALNWHGGGSLRLDNNTDVRLISPTRVRLISGALYYDSISADKRSLPSRPLVVETANGTVRHLGTQFMVQVATDGIVVAVREGRVNLQGPGIDETINYGQRVRVGVGVGPARGTVAAQDGFWSWAEQIAPFIQTGEPTAAVLLDWIARETGRTVTYHADSRLIAEKAVVRGVVGVSPSTALRAMSAATDLDIAISEDRLDVVSQHGR